ncbi:MAG: nucleoside monophosphate kinase [bacterium]|nr:nucleoside monophosphate kinase [bacterium]
MTAIVPTDTLHIILIGPYGAGKGTQAQWLVRDFDLAYFVAGEVMKDEIRRKTKLGKQVEPIVRAGKLVPDSIVLRLLSRFLKKMPADKGFVIDGSPRNVVQKKLIDDMLDSINKRTINILIDIPERESLRRLSKRLICEGCGHKPIGRELSNAECRVCKGYLVKRYDDQPAIIKKRLAVYKKEVVPAIEAYRREGRLLRVDGNQSRASVYRDIVRLLATLGFEPKKGTARKSAR